LGFASGFFGRYAGDYWLAVTGGAIVINAIQYNEFSLRDVHYAGMSLRAYSIGLLGYINQGAGAGLYCAAGYENASSLWLLRYDSQFGFKCRAGFSFGARRVGFSYSLGLFLMRLYC